MGAEVLGNGINRAVIATRDGRTPLLDVPATSIEWNRTLCEVSRAEVTIASPKCTPALADVHPWAHSLVIYRNDERVWEGPIRKRVGSRTGLTLSASDVLGWTERRPYPSAQELTGTYVRTAAYAALLLGFSGDDPNITTYVQTLGGLPTVTGDLKTSAGEKYIADVLSDLSSAGLRYTALGRSILLWDSAYSPGTLLDLSPEDHLLADVTVTEDGDTLATEVLARNDDGIIGHAYHDPGGNPTDPFYGRVTALIASGGITPAGVKATAQQAVNRSYPIPLTIDVPNDAALRCDAPFPMRALVPGMLVPVKITTQVAWPVRGTFMLTGVTVKQTAGADEQVTVTLTPPSEVA